MAPDGSWIVSASGDKRLRIWDVPTGQARNVLSGHNGEVFGCAVAPGGSWLVSAAGDETLRIWDVASGETRCILSGHTAWVRACAVAPDGSWIVSASDDMTLRIWDVASGQPAGAPASGRRVPGTAPLRVSACASGRPAELASATY